MKFEFTSADIARTIERIEGAREKIVIGLRELVVRTVMEVRKEAELDMLAAKTGIKWSGLPNQSSAPGEVPAKQSGKMLSSISEYAASDGMSVQLSVEVDYGLYLHQGLKGDPSNARPIYEPAAERVAPSFIQGIIDVIEAVRI